MRADIDPSCYPSDRCFAVRIENNQFVIAIVVVCSRWGIGEERDGHLGVQQDRPAPAAGLVEDLTRKRGEFPVGFLTEDCATSLRRC